MEKIHVACGQFLTEPANKRKNVDRMIEIAGEAKQMGCEIISFAETIVTGYLPANDMIGLAEPIPGPTVQILSEAARKIDIAISFGFVEEAGFDEKPFNSLVVLDSQGAIKWTYRKMHLWKAENDWAQPGNQITAFMMNKSRYSGCICYDVRFPEVARLADLEGAEVLLASAAWMGPGDEWELAIRARALDNSLFTAAADSINRIDGMECFGRSIIVGPRGDVLAQAEEGKDCVISAILAPEDLDYQRNRVPLLSDRRPELYKRICQSV